MLGMRSVFADFQRAIIQTADVEHRILAALKAGKSIRKTAEECGINPSTVQRV